MKKKKIGVITLAITLIFLGALLLLKNFIDVDIKMVFNIAWPCIIVLFGLEIIITKTVLTKNSDETRAFVNPISVIVLCIIIITISVYSNFSFNKSLNLFSIVKHLNTGDFSTISSYKYKSTYDLSFDIDAEDKDEIQVSNSFGNVRILESLSDSISIAAKVTIKSNNQEYAEELSKNIVKIDESGRIVKVFRDLNSSKSIKDKAVEINVDYEILVPANVRVNVKNKLGDVIIRNIKQDLEINNEFGNIEVSDISGALKLKNYFGDIEAINILGSVDITNQHNNVYVENIEDDVTIKNQFGNIKVKNLGGNLNIDNEYGTVDIKDIEEDIFVNNKFGDIYVENANKFIKIISSNGNISLKAKNLIEKGMEIENELGNVYISLPSNQKGNFNILAEIGEIRNNFGLKVSESITDQSINDVIDDSSIKFYIRTRNGNINLNSD